MEKKGWYIKVTRTSMREQNKGEHETDKQKRSRQDETHGDLTRMEDTQK